MNDVPPGGRSVALVRRSLEQLHDGVDPPIFCGVFVVARVGHSFSYLGEKQPWRTISFGVGAFATLVMVGFLVRALVAAV